MILIYLISQVFWPGFFFNFLAHCVITYCKENGNSTYGSIDQFLRFFIFSTTFATRTHRPTARRYCAKQNSEQCEKKSTSDQTGSNQFEFQSSKTFVSKADKCDHQADADHAKAHVEDDVGAAGRLIRTVVISIEL